MIENSKTSFVANQLLFLDRVAASRLCERTDEQLLRAFIGERSEPAFAELVQRYGGLVLGVSRRIVGNEHDAEDVFQATFLVLARKAHSILRRASVSSWLHGVAYRIARKAKVAAARRRFHEKAMAQLRRLEVKPVDELDWSALAAVLDAEIEHLPERYRAPLILCYLQGHTVDEASAVLKCPRGTVGTHLARGRQIVAPPVGSSRA
jgi:RNA polymerase sigma-70 factor (ECF subfamily)